MEDLKKMLVIKESKQAPSMDSPKFNIGYASDRFDPKEWKGYRIISALKGSDQMILELNSALLNLPYNQRADVALTFIDDLKARGLEYRYRKINVNQSGGMFDQLLNFGKKNDTAHQIFINMPDEMWQDEKTIFSFLPLYGMKYFIHSRPNGEVLDPLFNGYLTDEEILGSFKLTCYDCPTFGQMGIYTTALKLADIKTALGI